MFVPKMPICKLVTRFMTLTLLFTILRYHQAPRLNLKVGEYEEEKLHMLNDPYNLTCEAEGFPLDASTLRWGFKPCKSYSDCWSPHREVYPGIGLLMHNRCLRLPHNFVQNQNCQLSTLYRVGRHVTDLGFVCFLSSYCFVCPILLGQVGIWQNGQIN